MKHGTRILALVLVLSIFISLGVSALADAEPAAEPAPETVEPAAEPVPVEEVPAPEPEPEEVLSATPPPVPAEEPAAAEPAEEEPLAEEAPAEIEALPEEELTSLEIEEAADASAEPAEEPAAEERPWVRPGNTDAEILGGGFYLRDGGTLYYSDGGLWASVSGSERLLSEEQGGSLNLQDGWLYYTTDGGDVRRIPASGGSAETVYSFGSSIRQMYVMGDELRFVSGGSVWSYDMAADTLTPVEAPSGVEGLIPRGTTPSGRALARCAPAWSSAGRTTAGSCSLWTGRPCRRRWRSFSRERSCWSPIRSTGTSSRETAFPMTRSLSGRRPISSPTPTLCCRTAWPSTPTAPIPRRTAASPPSERWT